MSDIDTVFSPGGLLASHLPGYEPRLPQIKMAKAVEQSFAKEKHLIVEAGTGVGKSIAYLVPSIFSEGRVVVATANIALQEQLVKKDLPFLQEVLPTSFDFALVKGRSNYLCKDLHKNTGQKKLEFGGKGEEDRRKIDRWAQQTETGDKSELPFVPDGRLWSLFASSTETCDGDKCEYRKDGTCFFAKARQKLEECQVLVCNYHLLFSHVNLKWKFGVDALLPSFEYLVCDEGHRIADIARSFFGWSLGDGAITHLINLATKVLADSGIRGALKSEVVKTIGQVTDKVEEERDRLWGFLVDLIRGGDQGSKRVKKGEVPTDGLVEPLGALADSFETFSEIAEKLDPKMGRRLKKAGERCVELSGQLLEIQKADNDNAVYYVSQEGEKKRLVLNKRVLDVSGDLWSGLFNETKSTVVTSATLAVGQNDYEYVRREIGLKEAKEMTVGSPFDYRSQGLLVVSDRAPDPQAKDYVNRVCQILEYIINEVGGRTLGLFTSYKNMWVAKEYLADKMNGRVLLCQGDAPRMQLVKKFKEDVDSVLLGTESFWAGVDVPGRSLSCVVIDRIPFKSPGDPVWAALTERSDNWFFELAIPAAAVQLKQGVGRLIRHSTDCGVVVILDRRMVTKGYGQTLVSSLPGMRRSGTIKGSIRRWFAEHSKEKNGNTKPS